MKFSLKKLLYNKKFMCAFSIIVSFSLWLIISIYQNPVREHTISNITVNIPTDAPILSTSGMDIVSGDFDKKVNVKVSGPNYIVSSLSASDILVSASLSEVTKAGTYDLELVATQNSSKSGYTFLNISPSTVTVTFDNIDTKEFTVTPVANGVSAASGLVADTPVVSDSAYATVTIKGPRSDIALIDKVIAVADINKELSATESFDAKLKLIDASGNEIDKSPFTISAEDTLKISIPILQKAEVPIVAVFTNAPSGYESFLKYTLEHTTVTVLGPPDTISTLEKITLAPIDFHYITKTNNSFDVALELPNGVKTVDKITDITVEIVTSSFTEKSFTVKNIEYKNVDSSLTASASKDIRNVTVCGPSKVIKSLSAEDIYAEVDLSGKAAGEHTVAAKILARNGENIWQVGEYTAIITLS